MKKRQAQKQAAEVVQTGCASFTSKQIRSFQEIDFPDVAVSLDVSDNKIPDFIGFEPKITLESLRVDRNPIVSFHGFPEQHMILHFSAKQTPISELPNFRQLTLLAIGAQLETINDVPVTQSELQSISGVTLAGHFFRKTVTKISDTQQDQISKQLSDAIRNGYVASSFPRKISVITDAVASQESDPVTVRAMRLMNILRKDEESIKSLIKQLFCPLLSNKAVKKTQVVDERLAKQQSLINFMTDQLNEIKMERLQKIQQIEYQAETNDYNENRNENPASPAISDETKALYEKMVEEVAFDLVQNSEEEKGKEKNYWGLRAAVIRLLGVSEDLSDRELASLLRDQIEDIDYNQNNQNNDNNNSNNNDNINYDNQQVGQYW